MNFPVGNQYDRNRKVWSEGFGFVENNHLWIGDSNTKGGKPVSIQPIIFSLPYENCYNQWFLFHGVPSNINSVMLPDGANIFKVCLTGQGNGTVEILVNSESIIIDSMNENIKIDKNISQNSNIKTRIINGMIDFPIVSIWVVL